MKGDSLVTSLCRPLIQAMAKAGFDQKELLSGALEHTDLYWQAPPLVAEAPLGGVPLHVYLDRRYRVNVDRLYAFWCDALAYLKNAPYKVITDEGWRHTSYVMPVATQGERCLRFTRPDGFPAHTTEYAAITLSLECANLLQNSTSLVQFVSDDDNYYAVTSEGYEIGVRDGLPVVSHETWDIPVNGMVQDLLRLPRGEGFTGCDYDIIAKLRSVLHTHRERFKEFEGMDMALQALRVLAHGRHLQEAANMIARLKSDETALLHRVKVLREAVEIANLFTISDRARIIAIRSLLVPDVISLGDFKRTLYHQPHNPPATLTPAALTKLQQGLEALLLGEEANL
jgi:hypothetical protein